MAGERRHRGSEQHNGVAEETVIVWQAAEAAPGRALSSLLAVFGLLALALAACTTTDPGNPAGPSRQAAGTQSSDAPGAATAPPQTTARTAPAKADKSSEAPAALASLPPATAPAAREAPTPARLKGFTVSELRAALGAPTLLRRDGPAQLWQYAGSGCVLHVFLYDETGGFRVRYSEVRIDDPGAASPPTCVEWKATVQARSDRPVPAAPRMTTPGAAAQPVSFSPGER
jgi:hypothetical protein